MARRFQRAIRTKFSMGENMEGDSELTLVNEISYMENEKPAKQLSNEPPQVKLSLNGEHEKQCCNLIKSVRNLETSLDKKLRELNKRELSLKKANGILSAYCVETKTLELVTKWRVVCQCSMAYMLNAVKLKIDRMGGYQEFKRKEVESKKKRIDYQYDDSLQNQICEVLESPDYFHLPEEDKIEIKARIDEKIEEIESVKQKELLKLELEVEEAENKEFTMQDLATRLKVDHSLVFL